MLTLRTVDGVVSYFRKRDPHTALTKNYVRTLIKEGEIPVVRSGNRQMIAIESVDEYLSSRLGGISMHEQIEKTKV